jgi:hypothetical protein
MHCRFCDELRETNRLAVCEECDKHSDDYDDHYSREERAGDY